MDLIVLPITGIIVLGLQYIVSRQKSRYPGIALPILYIIMALILKNQIITENNLPIFVYCTVVCEIGLILVYFITRSRITQNKKAELKRMSVQDL